MSAKNRHRPIDPKMFKPVVRENGRIIFGEGDVKWSVTDPDVPEYPKKAKDLAYDWTKMLYTTPTIQLLNAKVMAIRTAIRTVPRTPLRSETRVREAIPAVDAPKYDAITLPRR